MKFRYIRLYLIVAVIALSSGIQSMAQMQPARRIAPKVIKGVSLSASTDEVWTFITSPGEFYSSIDEVKNLKCSGQGLGAQISFCLPGDKHRVQEISVMNTQERVMAYYITQSDYYDQPLVYRIVVGKDEEDAYVQFEAIFSTEDKAQEEKIEDLVINEWLLMQQNLEKQFN